MTRADHTAWVIVIACLLLAGFMLERAINAPAAGTGPYPQPVVRRYDIYRYNADGAAVQTWKGIESFRVVGNSGTLEFETRYGTVRLSERWGMEEDTVKPE